MRSVGAGTIVVLIFVAAGVPAICGAQQASEKPSVAELQQDIRTLGIINYINPTPQQMQKMAQIVAEYRKVVDAPPPAEVIDALQKARELLIKGASRTQAEQQAKVAEVLSAYTKRIDAARTKALKALEALLTEDQKQALATLRTPYEYFQQLVWEIGASRAMKDDEWQKWAEDMVKRLSTSRRGRPLMSATEAQQYLQRVRGMNDQQWAQEAAALYQRLVQRLPSRWRQALDNPRAVQQRIRRNLQTLLDNPRTPQLLQACIEADQAARQK